MRYLFEEYAFDTDRRELHRGADVVSVAPQVFDLLDYLIRNRERVVSKDDLINAIWNGRIVSDAALTTRLNAARTAIGDSGEEQRLIRTLSRKGFRFVGMVNEERVSAPMLSRLPERPNDALAHPDRSSIAVLPFSNISADRSRNILPTEWQRRSSPHCPVSKALFVIARNSSFAYKGRAIDVKQVGREPGCSMCWRGAFAKRHAACASREQLVDTATGAHLWADRFEVGSATSSICRIG